MICKKTRRLLQETLAVVFLMTRLLQVFPVYAGVHEGYCLDKPCSVTIKLEDLETKPDGIAFEIYQVGTVYADLTIQFRLLDVYRSTGIDLNHLVLAKDQEEAAKKLSRVLDESTLIREVRDDGSGVLCIDALEQGAYIVKQKDTADYGKVAPFLVFLPYGTDEKWKNNLTIFPKMEHPDMESPAGKDNQMTEIAQIIGTGDRSLAERYTMWAGTALCVIVFAAGRKRKN